MPKVTELPCKVEKMTEKDLEIKKQIERSFGVGQQADDFYKLLTVDWPIQFASVKIQIRNGKPTLLTIERTVKLD